MNILSLISFFNAYSFTILGICVLKGNYKVILNRLAASVHFCFAIWAFAYTFFYTAPTISEAMYWHRISSFGWILLPTFTTHFFLVLTEKIKKITSISLLYIVPGILLIKALFGSETPVARGFVQSNFGLGWTYDLNIQSIWFWFYVLYNVTYYSIALYYTHSWAIKSSKIRFLKQAKGIIYLNVVMINIGFFTDLILPYISTAIPPVFNLISIFWGIGSIYITRILKIMDIDDTASPDLILETVMDPILLLDSYGIIVKCNQATEDLLKYNLDYIINKSIFDFCKSQEYGREKLDTALVKKVIRNIEIDLIDSEGNTINALTSFSVAESKLDRLVGIVLSIHDVTKLKKIEKELYNRKEKYKKMSRYLDMLANEDKVTGIGNRRFFTTKLKSAIDNYKESEIKFALIFIDLDGFKPINDLYGHEVGDLILKKVSKMLFASIRKQDTVTRIGGDEFVIIFSDLENDLELNDILQKMKEKFYNPIIIGDNICKVGISIGVSKCPEDGVAKEILMRLADERMYKDKMSKKQLIN